jgi:hypothetical protein
LPENPQRHFREKELESQVIRKHPALFEKGVTKKGHEMIMVPHRYPTSFGVAGGAAILSGYRTELLLLEVHLFSSSMSHGQEDVHKAFSGLLRSVHCWWDKCNCSAPNTFSESSQLYFRIFSARSFILSLLMPKLFTEHRLLAIDLSVLAELLRERLAHAPGQVGNT